MKACEGRNNQLGHSGAVASRISDEFCGGDGFVSAAQVRVHAARHLKNSDGNDDNATVASLIQTLQYGKSIGVLDFNQRESQQLNGNALTSVAWVDSVALKLLATVGMMRPLIIDMTFNVNRDAHSNLIDFIVKDSDNHIFPLMWVLVPSKSQSSWRFALVDSVNSLIPTSLRRAIELVLMDDDLTQWSVYTDEVLRSLFSPFAKGMIAEEFMYCCNFSLSILLPICLLLFKVTMHSPYHYANH